MNREEIIAMARESCDKDKVDAWHNGFWTLTQYELERFAALVAAAEREACARLIEEYQQWIGVNAKKEIAEAIRARGETK